jgi:hypothetical protein
VISLPPKGSVEKEISIPVVSLSRMSILSDTMCSLHEEDMEISYRPNHVPHMSSSMKVLYRPPRPPGTTPP